MEAETLPVTDDAVAPLTGSLDRNVEKLTDKDNFYTSLPSRGAWIEILSVTGGGHLLKSLPSRGAWIDICRAAMALAAVIRRSPRGERG